MTTPCPLCELDESSLIWQNDKLAVIDANETDYPGFCRVIWRQHQTEMTQLEPDQRQRLMAAVFTVEQQLIEQLHPDKVNLASLGNQVAHLHWHVIPRFKDDRHFPDAVWATAKRQPASRQPISTEQLTDWLQPTLDQLPPN
ncbi:MAG: HIT family protein [Immundisolibacteraceae bacterium]|nr:HIT family protein [Immundisolibacteraceae bacterium]